MSKLRKCTQWKIELDLENHLVLLKNYYILQEESHTAVTLLTPFKPLSKPEATSPLPVANLLSSLRLQKLTAQKLHFLHEANS